ncbi:NAD kinase [Lacihabitans sp. CCS-44]|uniref:NAD kinase n=1 Tax=Lacihabitans sp. CCS-44 TaxID=2487331 RepID=UPI0020CC3CBA|nr:NAD kinase [Lacihabitans sp. CCS-44]MCP9754612.1 NAD kinase [Lacihabitans sp. CCS-44]
MKFAIHGRVFKSDSTTAIQDIFDELKDNKISYQVSDSFTEILQEAQIQFDNTKVFKNAQDLHDIDIALSLGGDGSFLETLGLVASNEIPVLGINFGRLGFLTDIQPQNIKKTIKKILAKQYKIDERLMIHAEAQNEFFESGMNFALNEIAISKTDTSSMIVIHAYIDGDFLNSYWADGLMVSTPTGSTGYNLSCGGPLVMPKSENFIITPICPHNLFVRPIIVSSQSKITLKVESRSKNFLVSMDSRAKIIGDDVGEININMETFKAKLVKIDGMSFLSTLRKKLNWGDDIRNRN